MEISLLPFVVEALGYNKTIYKDIDRLYQKHRFKYYKAAKSHELYNHQIVTEGSLLQEEYCKKSLGIFLCINTDKKNNEGLEKIIRKGWPYPYLYVENHTEIDIGDFLNRMVKKAKGVGNLTDDDLNTSITMLVFLATNSEKKITENKASQTYFSMIMQRMDHYKDSCTQRISYSKISDIDKQKIKNLKSKIYEEFGIIKDFESIESCKSTRNFTDILDMIFDYEKLSACSLMSSINLSMQDIDELLYLYVISHTEYCAEDAVKFLITTIYIKYLAKAYKQVKEHYFANNKETMYIELEGLEQELNDTKAELSQKNAAIIELQKHLEQKDRELVRLRKELEVEKENRQEFNSLREFMFSLDKQQEYTSERPDLSKLNSVRGLILGGHPKWQEKMKELLPEFTFLSTDNINFDINIVKNIDIAFVYTDYLNHAIYEKLITGLKKYNKRLEYLAYNVNENIVLQQIYQKL